MDFQMISVTQRVEVEGRSDREAVGEFSGRVIAVAFQGGDPVGDPVADVAEGEGAQNAPPEGFGGFGTTYFLVAGGGHPAPFWVSKDDVERTRVS